MADREYDLFDSALVGHVVSIDILCKLVQKNIISSAEACEMLEDCLLKLEEWQATYPEVRPSFEGARDFLASLVDAARSRMRIPPE